MPAAIVLFKRRNPTVETVPLGEELNVFACDKYPVVSTPPLSPNRTIMLLVPFVLTPLNITVIRLTQEGMPVKSIEVPDVEATAVPEDTVLPAGEDHDLLVSVCAAESRTTVPVAAGNVAVKLLAVDAALI